MSQQPIPWDSHAVLAQDVRKLLAEVGPLTPKEIMRRLRCNGSPKLKSSAVHKVLDQTLAGEIQRLSGNVYCLIDKNISENQP